jgi:hypothetical protein
MAGFESLSYGLASEAFDAKDFEQMVCVALGLKVGEVFVWRSPVTGQIIFMNQPVVTFVQLLMS